jgi:biopolymer transport protein ExbD
MSFSVRHAGSPKWVSDLSAAEVAVGLRDGRWEPTDEVWGEGEDGWVPVEDHPRFAETVADLEPPPKKDYGDETRLDMNPLIDVALVLLIFFILTTTYETVRKVLDMPGATAKKEGVRVITPDQAKKLTVLVSAKVENGQPVIQIERTLVSLEGLTEALQRTVADTKKTTLLIDADKAVDYGVVMAIIDAARGAGMTRTLMLHQPADK